MYAGNSAKKIYYQYHITLYIYYHWRCSGQGGMLTTIGIYKEVEIHLDSILITNFAQPHSKTITVRDYRDDNVMQDISMRTRTRRTNMDVGYWIGTRNIETWRAINYINSKND